jgi:hypothetical protein
MPSIARRTSRVDPLPAGDARQLMGNLPEGSRLGMRLAGPCADESDARGIRLC